MTKLKGMYISKPTGYIHPSHRSFFLLKLVNVKWNGKKFENIELDVSEPALVFKTQLFALTNVDVDRQKIMIKGGMLKVTFYNR